jgi:NTP pyrophosphatase (non-canonical NTP hydrolase)
MKQYANTINDLSKEIFDRNLEVGWWESKDAREMTDTLIHGHALTKPQATLIASKLALCHSELSEALEGMRKGLNDDHLPHRPMIEVELADTIIRILDLSGFMNLDIGGALIEKMAYNQKRQDHKKENRMSQGGKTI